MTTHSKIGASSMYRWSACPGSVRLSEGIEPTQSAYAEEGTVAHELAAKWLATGKKPKFPDQDTEDAVKVYTDVVFSLYKDKDDELLVEHQFDLSKVYPGCFGTADAVIYKGKTKTLYVWDYKHGAGIFVSAANNPQLNYYALGALLTCGFDVDTVVKGIVQPRLPMPDGVIRSETVMAIDLLDFKVDLQEYAYATESVDAPLVPGEHCRFCPAARVCPALESHTTEIAKLEFSAALSYDPAKLKRSLDALPAVRAWIKMVDEFAYAEAEAGRCPDGYKLVEKRATRKWRDEQATIDGLRALGAKPAIIFEPPTLKSPAQMEKVLSKDTIAQYVESASSGHTLVPDTDKRPAVKLDARSDFAAITVEPEGGDKS